MTSSDPKAPRVLVADDQPDIREALRLLFKGEGFESEAVSSGNIYFTPQGTSVNLFSCSTCSQSQLSAASLAYGLSL
jgi:CheY-like chemotaxis protein